MIVRISLLLLLTLNALAQSTPPKNYSALQHELAALPDTIRIKRLNDFQSLMLEEANYIEATHAIREMMQIAQESQRNDLFGLTYGALGNLERCQNNATGAIQNYQKAANFFSVGHYYKSLSRMYQRISGVYLDLRELTMAEHYSKKALAIAQQKNLESEIAYNLTDMATIADIRKQYKQALLYNEQAINSLKKLGEDYSPTLMNRGIIYKNAGLYKQSVDTYEETLKIAREKKDTYLEAYVYLNLPNTLILLNRLDEAERYIRLALNWIPNQPQKQNLYQEAYETLSKIYEKKNDFRQALNYHKKWATYRDSVFNAEKSQQLIETETRFQTREKQHQIQQLDEDNLRQKQQLGWLAIGVFVLGTLLFLAVWQYQTIRRVNAKLSNTNQILLAANQRINKQAHQLRELMRELHHRVKNNLAIVSSLLSLQSSRIDDEKAIRVVRDGQQRVDAMSLIHQQLYSTDNVTSVNMQEYIGDLLRRLTQSFSYRDNFDLQLDVAPIEVDVEVAVPLGLIVNELVTNAFKHAYQNVSNPKLSIRLWEDDAFFLEVADNGSGIDLRQWHLLRGSFGKTLIESLVNQLEGHLEVDNEQGTRFRLSIPVSQIHTDWHRPTIEQDEGILA